MQERILKAKEDVNIRKGSPTVRADNAVGVIHSGQEFSCFCELISDDSCEEINGNRSWYKLAGNLYMWSGGFEKEKDDLATNLFDGQDIWWVRDFGVDNLWEDGLSGKGVRIAVLDTGLSLPHPDLPFDEDHFTDVTGSFSGIKDWWGHGTHVTGIIGAADNGIGIKGIAPDAELFVCKIRHDDRGDNLSYLRKGLKWALDLKVDIVSISLGFKKDDGLHELIVQLHDLGSLIVCAAGNGTSDPNVNILFPASYQETLSVGGVDRFSKPLPDTLNASQTDIFAPGKDILSTFLNGKWHKQSGSSQACPYVAGVAALWLERERRKRAVSPKDLKGELMEHSRVENHGRIIKPF